MRRELSLKSQFGYCHGCTALVLQELSLMYVNLDLKPWRPEFTLIDQTRVASLPGYRKALRNPAHKWNKLRYRTE